jgi:phosphosulfolactate phosphohydrolase-like enzyme
VTAAPRARLVVFHSAAALPDPAVPRPADAGAAPVACVVVADILRHTTTLVRAFAAGARSARAFPTLDDARAAHAACADAPRPHLCGEGLGLKPHDFDLGNSPREYTQATVGGRDLYVATTNGAPALARAPRGAPVLAAAFTNLSAVAARIGQLVAGQGACEVWLVAAGQSGDPSPEDDLFVAVLAHRLSARGVVAGPWPSPEPLYGAAATLEEFLRATPHGRGLVLADPEFAEDITIAARIDSESVVPEGRDGTLSRTQRL